MQIALTGTYDAILFGTKFEPPSPRQRHNFYERDHWGKGTGRTV